MAAFSALLLSGENQTLNPQPQEHGCWRARVSNLLIPFLFHSSDVPHQPERQGDGWPGREPLLLQPLEERQQEGLHVQRSVLGRQDHPDRERHRTHGAAE